MGPKARSPRRRNSTDGVNFARPMWGKSKTASLPQSDSEGIGLGSESGNLKLHNSIPHSKDRLQKSRSVNLAKQGSLKSGFQETPGMVCRRRPQLQTNIAMCGAPCSWGLRRWRHRGTTLRTTRRYYIDGWYYECTEQTEEG